MPKSLNAPKSVGLRRMQFEIVALGLLEQALLPEQTGALGTRLDRIGLALQQAIELLDARNSGSSAADNRSRQPLVIASRINVLCRR